MLPKSRDKVAIGVVAAVIAVVIGAALVVFLPSSLRIDDVSRAQTYRLTTSADDSDVYGIEISGRGEFQGTVTLELMTPERQVIREVNLDNGGTFELQNDWYAAEALIRVTPGTARAGQIALTYRFREFL